MKKMNLKSILLIAFAFIAVYIACMPTSVAVYNLTQPLKPFHCSYFNLVENVVGNIFLPLAGLCACVNLMIAGVYLAIKKGNLLSAIKVLSMVTSILAVLPILIKNPEIQLVPNVLLPIAMLAEYAVAAYMAQKPATSVESPLRGNRLK